MNDPHHAAHLKVRSRDQIVRHVMAGLVRLARLDPPEPVRRYRRSRPGVSIHPDIEKPGGFESAGHRVAGTRKGCRSRDAAGREFVHAAVDAATRLAHVEVLPDERKETTAAFLLGAPAPARLACARLSAST
ncbi:MAG TPA: hypothetical protein PKA33_14790 [Amaricoccus sp.]|uniref:hypothetical protein n=1 Tax=Amaricoccus sp. TaxID=1872485 RepID=UPI002CFB86B4|nr:hypothetical protein [Amaricoccus sp.]HMQ93795.1 hypothetical protein [Amaricoccus sp.]HMR53523.1 hypothetical protein [Amaricoccus sp.]HMR60821.1 hypothetical protein [Amaricoccus sp.]HMU00617.1 hypothetical protein [Amaricoccus sp.]